LYLRHLCIKSGLTFYLIAINVLLISWIIKMKYKIDYKEITKLIDLLEERDLSNFELEIEGFKIKISRSDHKSSIPSLSYNPSVTPEEEPEEKKPLSESKPKKSQNNLHYITSPMVGTFYRAPDPSSPPFVEIGEPINKNQILCIIEAMKLMNEVESDIDGVLEEIFINNGAPIEYGQRLFAIKPL